MEIVPGIWRVPGTRGSNVYLIVGEQAALIDTGLPGNTGAIVKFLTEHGLAPRDLSAIFVTHRHGDHTGSLSALRAATGARTLGNAGDAALTSRGSGRRRLAELRPRFGGKFPAQVLVRDGQQFPEFRGLTALATPGHTPGSLSFWIDSAAALFTGDTVLSLGNRLARPLAPPWKAGQELEASLARLAALHPRVLASGHGPPVVARADDLLQELRLRPPRPLFHRVVMNWRRLLRFGQDMSRPSQ